MCLLNDWFLLESRKLCCTKVGYLPMAVHQHLRDRSSSSSSSSSSVATWTTSHPVLHVDNGTSATDLTTSNSTVTTTTTAATTVAPSAVAPGWFSERSLWWHSVLLTDKMRAFLFLWIFVLLLLHVAGGGQRDEPARSAGKGIAAGSDAVAAALPCSRLCQCEANAVDCSNRGLTQVPLDLPKDADKM